MRFVGKQWGAVGAILAASAALAGSLMQQDAPVVVSKAAGANNAFKAKMGWISYKSAPSAALYDVKAQLLVFADGEAGKQNIYIARSTDNGATWAEQAITTNGGDALKIGATDFTVTHNKPNLYVAPVGVINGGKGANALVSWTSSDCEGSTAQKINNNLIALTGLPQPYMCLWVARSVDGGASWTKQRLTDGSLDADEDVPTGYVKYSSDTASAGGFAISFQADPAGLQLGEAEGPGDGASGAKVSPGTNIWYSFINKANFESGQAFPAPVQVSDNNAVEDGAPGASRANLAISGGTAVLAYEETKGDGSSGKRIVYHSFGYASPDTNSAGTAVSDGAMNARRVRFVLQGNDAIGDADGDGDAADGDTKGVHVAMLWRETVSLVPAAASDIVMRRGIKNTAVRTGSTGFLPADVLADTPLSLSDTGPRDNALAHRAQLRGESLAVAYDHTPDKAAADEFIGTYNLFIRRSTDGGDTWGGARNISNLLDASTRVVEPRLVGTPGTIKLPNGQPTGLAEDVQDRNVFFVAWGTETNDAAGTPLDIYLTRTTDGGDHYERVQRLADGPTEQSEAQLRTQPDGKTLGALWMERDAVAGTEDVVYRNGIENPTGLADPDLNLSAIGASFAANAQGQVTYTLLNEGPGEARLVVLSGTVPAGLTIVSTSEPTLCAVNGASFSCTVPELLASQRRAIGVTVSSATAGTYALPAQVVGDVVETDSTDNAASAAVTVADAAGSGGGCSASDGQRPVDPLLPLLAALGLAGWGLRRTRSP